MDSVLISIIVPVYKVEPYIDRCIKSLISQTYQNIEIILVDDGDNCGKICDKYAQTDSRIIVIHKKNGGLSSARNAGLDICRGEFIMFADSDDWVEPNFCEDALHLALTKEVDCVAFGYYVYQNGKRTSPHTSKPRIVGAEEAIIHMIRIGDVIRNYTWNKIYNRKLFEDIRYPIGRLYEDQGTTYKTIIRAEKIYVSDMILYHYDKRRDSITGSSSIPRIINDKFELWLERLEIFKNYSCTLYQEEIKHIARYSVSALKRIELSKEKKLKAKLSEFLQTNRDYIKKLNCNSKSLSLYYNAYPLFWMLNKIGLLKHSPKNPKRKRVTIIRHLMKNLFTN